MRSINLDDLEILPLVEEDIPENLELLNLVIREGHFLAQREEISEREAREFFEYWVESGLAIYLVAKYNGKIIAHISCRGRTEDRLYHIANIGYLVHPDYRKLGIGSLLIERTINLAPNKDFEILVAEVSDDNTRSIRLLKKFGFEKFGRLKNALKIDDNDNRDIIMFSKHL
ncbi:MAG: GNAT family N-acetyltransferase [Candidatus Lokiarchaeota archaeon]|nr:GNAT family N-acetyltransferase [Candidatus Lokiarchaeota archaeon]